MAKAILEFDLEDFDDKLRHMQVIKAVDVLLALNKISERLRHYDKYEVEKTFTREEFYDILSSYKVDLDELLV